MNDLFIIDNYVDEREFRNYINSLFIKKGYNRVSIEDPRIADNDLHNNNDILIKKGEIYYTVQIYLNTDIKNKHVDETVKDMEKENVSAGIIITNNYVNNDMREYANKRLIQIWDRSELEKEM